MPSPVRAFRTDVGGHSGTLAPGQETILVAGKEGDSRRRADTLVARRHSYGLRTQGTACPSGQMKATRDEIQNAEDS